MWKLRTKILDFKKNIYDLYRNHIEDLQSISVNELEDIVLPNETDIVNRIFVDVKDAIQKEINENQKRREEEDLNAIPITKPEKNTQISDEEYIAMLTKKQSGQDESPEQDIQEEELLDEGTDSPVTDQTATDEDTEKE